jgi:DNA repair protein RadC
MTEKPPHKGNGHRGRLRERFLAGGLEGFHDYEVIELLLTLATPRKDCKATAKAALNQFGSLQAVMEASPDTLVKVPGIGPRNMLGIRLVKAVADRYLKDKVIGRDVLNNSRELFEFLYHSMRDKTREHFKVIFLDAKNRVLEIQTLFQGTLTASAVYPREVVKTALEKNAAALIFAHNHPSGEPEPSGEDLEITRQLLFACRVVGITVHEHIIIGANRYFSFADQGNIARMNAAFEKQQQVQPT